ncbi:Zinc finger, PMZ-type [Gossypium australe]|uniref:Zinc finger, PMZ-type n=1 Tax=Gossypium australe TaxID=47621 RepID=A0A5B6WPF2_9ROSI|nr:Zinc finger, PMZ-type [Gossypium australe]
MAMHRVTLDSPPYFKRFYKAGCRLILGLDGCFLKGHFKSEMLTVVGRDAKNQMYLVAWAMVEGECTDSWAWFLNLLTIDLDLEDGFGYTIISDKQKGLKIAIDEVLPRVEHKNCARHATTEREWEDKVENLKKKMKKLRMS